MSCRNTCRCAVGEANSCVLFLAGCQSLDLWPIDTEYVKPGSKNKENYITLPCGKVNWSHIGTCTPICFFTPALRLSSISAVYGTYFGAEYIQATCIYYVVLPIPFDFGFEAPWAEAHLHRPSSWAVYL